MVDAIRSAKMKQEHYDKYARIAEALGVERIHNVLRTIGITKEKVRAALTHGDEYLNSIPLPQWDRGHEAMYALYSSAATLGTYREPGGWSMVNSCSTLKHVAQYQYATRDEVDDTPLPTPRYRVTVSFDVEAWSEGNAKRLVEGLLLCLGSRKPKATVTAYRIPSSK